jgi:hypothetical protein
MSGPARSTAPDPSTDQFIQGIGPAAAISLVVGSRIGRTEFGLMIVALGLPVYFLWHRRGRAAG